MAVARSLQDELSFGAISRRERPLASQIPFSRHVTDEVIRTKDGMLMIVMKLDGYCFETADISEINVKLLGRNDIMRTLGNSRFALYTHLIRREIKPTIDSSFENEFCEELDKRYNTALSHKRMFVNDLYLTIVRRNLQGNVGTFDVFMNKVLGRKTGDGSSYDEAEAINELNDVATATRESLVSYGARQLKVVDRGGDYYSEPLEFLIQIINGAQPRSMHLPRMDLADALSQKRLLFGPKAFEIRGAGPEDTRYGAMVAIKEYPSLTGPGLFNALLRVPYEFVATQSFSVIDKPAAMAGMDRVGRQIDQSDEGGSIIAEHLDLARDDLLSSEAVYGVHHFTIQCLGTDISEVTKCITAVGAALTDASVIWVREDLAIEIQFWAQLPGNPSYISRGGIISSKNMAGFASLHNYPSGTPANNHWGPAISVLETTSQTAYYYNFHVNDLGNFTIVGPSGSGKTVFLGFIAAQAQRIIPRPKLVLVDKDRGLEIFVRAMGGQYEVLRAGEPTGFNPLQMANTGFNREFLYQLLSFMLRSPTGQEMTASEEQVIRTAIASLMSVEPEQRTFTEFSTLLRGRIRSGDNDLYSRLSPWIKAEQRGWLFNNPLDQFNVSSIFGFDMTSVLDDPETRTAALMYIFHRMEELLDGTPVMIFLDEGWRLLDDDVFSAFIKDKLKTIRKQNGIIGFGTQSAADIVRSKSASTLIEQTPTNIFFPNPKADDASYASAFRLSAREVNWVRTTPPESRTFLIKHGRDSVIARLNLGSMPDLIKVLSGRTETVSQLDKLREQLGDDPAIWLPVFLGRSQ